MNLKEGTRRLALLLGVAGMIGGGFVSYVELQAVLSQRARHNRFEQLAHSYDILKERKCRLLGYDSGCFRIKLPPGATLVEQAPNDWQTVPSGASQQMPPQNDEWSQYEVTPPVRTRNSKPAPSAKVYLNDNGSPISSAPSSETPTAKAMHSPPKPKYTIEDSPDPYAATAEPSSGVPTKFSSEAVTPLASEVNMDGIKTINWSQGMDYRVESIETEDGQTLYPTPAPSRWLYLLIALLPALGFLVPWGAVRGIGWVGAGFVAGPK